MRQRNSKAGTLRQSDQPDRPQGKDLNNIVVGTKTTQRTQPRKDWVIVEFKDGGTVKAWRDYGSVAWGSPLYTVLGYVTNSTGREALRRYTKTPGITA